MKFIELNIKCNNESDKVTKMRELDIPVSDDEMEYDYRPLYIRAELINGFYPNTEGGCFVLFEGMELTVSESYNEIKKLVE